MDKNISFIVLASFGYGVGTDKTLTTRCISALKKSKSIIDKPHKTVEKLLEGESGTTRHIIEMRLSPAGLRELLFDFVYPGEMLHTGGSITLSYGWCDAIAFNSYGQENFSSKCIDSAYLQACKLCKQLTGEDYGLLCPSQKPYVCQCIEAMAGYTDHSIYVTPVEEKDGKHSLSEEVWNFLEELLKQGCDDWEDEFVEYFDL